MNNTFVLYEVPPKSFYVEFSVTNNLDGSYIIDFTPANKTRRFFPAPPNPTTSGP